MREWEEKVLERQKGEDKMRDKMHSLFKALKKESRLEDYEKAVDDPEYCNQLFDAHGIE